MQEFNEIVISKMEDLSGLAIDQDSFKNPSYYRSSYNIPEEETLLVFAEGTFITDEAIYINPAKKPVTSDGRIPLSQICSFLIYENKNAEVKLFGEREEYQIFASVGRQAKSTAGRLVSLLRELQDTLMKNPENKRAYDRVMKRIYTVIRKEFRESGVLSEDLLSIIGVMEELPVFRREATFLALENEYRKGNRRNYDRLLNEKSRNLTPENLEVLKNPDDLFYINYINDLKDVKGYSNVKAIIEAYLQLKATPRLSLREASILCHLCVRMEDYELLGAMLDIAGDDFDEDELWGLFAFIARNKNSRVHGTFGKLSGLISPTEEELLRGNDLGLCSLHYALMFRNKELVRTLLPLCDWKSFKSPFPKERVLDAMYDFLFLGSLIFRDEALLREIFIYTSPKATALNRSIKQMNSKIDINLAMLRKYPDHSEEIREKIAEYTALRDDMESELTAIAKEEIERQRQLSEIIKEAGHPLCNYLFEMFSGSQAVLNWLNKTAKDYRICRYKQSFFVTIPGQDNGLSYYEWKSGKVASKFVKEADISYTGKDKRTAPESLMYDNPIFREQEEAKRKAEQAEKERRRKEFRDRVKSSPSGGGSWFSEKAHRDLKALKEEYRVLVKKYHPDSSKDARTAKILMRIMSERADILERIQ